MLKNVRLDGLRIGGKLLALFLGVGALATSAIGVVAYTMARDALVEEQFNKLTAMRAVKADQIESYFEQIRSQVVTFSEDRMVVEAMRELQAAFRSIPSEGASDELDDALRRFYEGDFLPALSENLEGQASVSRYWPQSGRARYLQAWYLARNPNPRGAKHELDRAVDGSAYSRVHERYHPVIRSYLEKFGYYDIFLIEPDTGHVVYSVFKEVDFGTSLLTGPYRNTNFAAVFNAARGADEAGFVRLEDFAPYDPSYRAAASFIASPIRDGGELLGVLVFQMPADRIDSVMTSNRGWAEIGLGASGETYLVGSDFRLRNESRFLIQDREGYLQALRAAGVAPETIRQIESTRSSIGIQEVRTPGTEAALRGETSTGVFRDYRGVEVFSAYKPLEIADVDWAIMSEIDSEEALHPVRSLRNQLVGWAVALLGVVGVVAVGFARLLSRPLEQLARVAQKIGSGDLTDAIEARPGGDEIADLWRAFASMRQGLAEVIGQLQAGVRQLSSSTSQIASTARQGAAAASELASTVAEVSTTTEEISQTSKSSAGNAQGVVRAAEEAAQQGQLGLRAVAASADAMGVITERVDGVAGKILQLSEQTAQIRQIVESVNGLAEQSNLLAVNASIEAAKAGEQGRGFAVVASEVRSLADQSKGAAQRINALLAEIQKATESAVMATEESNKRVADGRQSIESVRQVIEELASALEGSSDKARQIAGSATQQASGIAQISEAMESVGTAATDSASGAGQLEQAAADLSALSAQLEQASNRYRL